MIKGYLRELSIVILGIMIAFWLSNIGTKYKERDTQRKVLHTILNELEETNDNIKTTINSLDTLYVTFLEVRQSNALSDDISINYIGLSFRSIGYETAKYTGIFNDFDYNITSQIVENYESKFSLEDSEKIVVDELFKILKNKTVETNEIDYLLLQVTNLSKHLKRLEVNQQQLIKELHIKLDF